MRIIQLALLTIVGFQCLTIALAAYPTKPWPTYSLDNMPRTDFTCHGKILGGYYADPETKCQMFHVCVKLAGVGIKDYRFLCPNGTVFDQDTQICANWVDVDCEQSTLYYSNDNFDLYRLGSGFESKRAPADEDEQTFHLQNAESNDIRRTPHQNPSFNRNNDGVNYNDNSYSNKQNLGNVRNIAKVRPTTTSTTTTTTETSYPVDRRGDDEIFKGSHSSNFFNNRNNGKEDDLVDFPQKTQPFERNHNHRGRRPQNNYRNSYNNQNNNIQPFPTKPSEFPTESTTPSTTTLATTTTTTTTTYAPPTTRAKPTPTPVQFPQSNVKTVSLQSSFRTENTANNDYNNQQNNYVQNNGYFKSTTQQRIQPTTYSPPLNSFSADSSSPKYDDFRRFDKVSTTPEQKFKQPPHNSFYNAQFENKATENYDPIIGETFHNGPTTKNYDSVREPSFQNGPNAFAANNRTVEVAPNVVRNLPRINNRGQQNSFNTRQNEFNERPAFVERANTYSSDRSNSFVERPNAFDERPKATEQAHSIGENSGNNVDQHQQQSKPQRSQSRRPTRFRGTKTFNRAELEDGVSSPLNVRPLEIQTQPRTTAAPQKQYEQNFNEFTDNFRQSTPSSNRFDQNNFRQSTATGSTSSSNRFEQSNFRQSTATSSSTSSNRFEQNNFRQSTAIGSTPSPNRYEQNNYNAVNENFKTSPRSWESTTPNTYSSPSAYGFPEVNRISPSPFSLPGEQQNKQKPSANVTQPQRPFQQLPTFDESPRGFSLNPSYQNQAAAQPRVSSTTSRSYNAQKYEEQTFDSYTPATQVKKFSTLVPKDQFYPTTFKPATYKKVIQGYDQKLGSSTKYAASSYLPTTTTTTTVHPPSVNANIDEDDGQYHPELYERDFVRNKFKSRKQQVAGPSFEYDRRSQEPPSDTEDEEFLNTAHSLNIAAGANQLRAEKFKEAGVKNYRGPTVFYGSTPASATSVSTSTESHRTTTASPKSKPNSSKQTKKSKKVPNEDTSYDYAYYDSFNGNPQDYEYDLISEFGKTRKN